jgi:predicted RNase H-like HicB family nuclease
MAKHQFTYTVVYEHDPETGYICGSVPALELGTHGRTLDEARFMMREALELHLQGMLEENMPIPPDVSEIERLTVEVDSFTPDGTRT